MAAPFRFDLAGRTALVTGASSGAGRRFARILAGSGANVVVGARRIDMLDALCAEIGAEGGQALAVRMDVSDEASTIAAFDAAERRFGGVDSVVANAGINIAGSALGIAAEDIDKVMAVNLRGVFLTVREGARRMIAAGSQERGHGRIAIISSVTSHHPAAGVAAYSATKAAVTQLGRALAKDWARKGVNVNVICPGYMLTDLTDGMWELDMGRKLLAEFPRGRIMDVDALDPMLLYLCSDVSAQVTGSVFTIDDGQTL
jgi:NAD(P)-dependent dehydrogenase (short-subunit alcohol dehydrogenase family)